jgi:hypothetical protein
MARHGKIIKTCLPFRRNFPLTGSSLRFVTDGFIAGLDHY